MTSQLTEDQVRLVVKDELNKHDDAVSDAVEKGVTAALLSLGINRAEAGEALEVQRDMAFLRTLRSGQEAMKTKTFVFIIGAVLTTIGALTTAGIMAMFGGNSS